MRIDVYTAADEHVPDERRFVAYIVAPMPRLKGPVTEVWPIWFGGRTAEEARGKAQNHWDEKVEKERNAKPRGRPKKDAIDTEADPGDVI